MKKSLYKLIIVSILVLSLGAQVSNATTVFADETEKTNESTENNSEVDSKSDEETDPDKKVVTTLDEDGKVFYVYDEKTKALAHSYTEAIFDVKYGTLLNLPKTSKNELLLSLTDDMIDFMNDHSADGKNDQKYKSYYELDARISQYNKAYAEANKLADDWDPNAPVVEEQPVTETKPVVKPVYHTTSNTNEVFSKTVTTNKQATLFTDEGKKITNRALIENSSWRVDKAAVINGQKMYHVATNEWVAASDVQ